MAYLGQSPSAITGRYAKLDDISSGFNGSTTTFNLASGGDALTVQTETQLIVSLDNTILEPQTDYSVNGSQITFATAPSNGVDHFATLLGDTYIVGVPPDNTLQNRHIKSDAAIAMSKTALVGGTGLTLSTNTLNVDAAQTQITSLGTLTALQVDNLNINTNTISATSGALNITPASGSAIVLDGTVNVDAGVITGATSITSTAFVGALTGNVTGNVSGSSGSTTGNAATATALATARTIGGTSFDGTANIDVALATLATTVTVSDSTANTNFPVVFNNESNALLDDTGALRYNPSTGTLLVPNLVVAGTTTTVYAVLALEPKLVFDFTGNVFKTGGASSNFGASITHSRASSATMINASGTLVTVGNNVPRTGHHIYNGSAWVNEGILHESEARTNVCTYSNEFVLQAFLKWLPANITVTANSEVSPDGTTNATKFDMASNGYTRKTTGHVPSVGETYTFSVWIKAGTASEVNTALLFSGGGLGYTSVTHTLTNEWQRFTVTAALASGTPDQVRARFVATQAGTIFVYGAQIEEGAFPSSYIPTGSATVTRAAETLTVPAANLPYDSTNMSIQIDGKMTGDTLTPVRWLLDADNSILLETGTNNFSFLQEAGGTVDTVTGGSFTGGTNVTFNLATRNGSTFINSAISGTSLTADTTPTALPNLSATDLILGYDFMGTIGQFRMWDEDLGDAGITVASIDGSADGAATFNSTVTATTFVGALTGNVTGNASGTAATATILETARTIGGVSFNGSANISLPGVNSAGNQNTTGSAATLTTARTIGGTSFDGSANIDVALATLATTVTITDNESTNENNALIFTAGGDIDGGNLGLESDGTLTYNPSTGKITATGFVGTLAGAVTGDVTGNADTATALATARTIGGTSFDGTANIAVALSATATALATARTLGGVSFDGTANINLPGVNSAGNQNTTGSAATLTTARTIGGTSFNGSANIDVALATLATTVTVSDSIANTNFPVVFTNESNALLDDTGALRYNPSTGTLLVPNLVVAGTTTQVDTVTMNAANAVVFEGATADAYETTLTITDPTADRTITLPDVTGTVALTSSDITGNAATATILETARTIGGVSFNGSANINLPGVNTAGNQNTSGSAATLTTARTIGGVSFNGSANIDLPGVNSAGNQNTTGSAATLTTGRTIGMTGDVVWISPSFTGSGNVTAAATIQSGAVETAMIAADAITAALIGDNVINSEHYAAGSIDAEHMAANSIDSDAYVDGSIDREHLAAYIVDGTKIASNVINSEHYVDGSIDREHLAADIIDGTKIADGAINSEHYAAGSVDDAHLASDFVHAAAADTASGRITFTGCSTNNHDDMATAGGSQGGIEIQNSGVGNDAFMAFHAGGDYALYFGLDADSNQLAVGGWSMGAAKYQIVHQGRTDIVTEAMMANDAIGSAELKTLSTLLIKNSSGTTLKTIHGAGA